MSHDHRKLEEEKKEEEQGEAQEETILFPLVLSLKLWKLMEHQL